MPAIFPSFVALELLIAAIPASAEASIARVPGSSPFVQPLQVCGISDGGYFVWKM
jgi:hypothetical protein